MQKVVKEKIFLKKLNREIMLEFFTIADDEYLMDTFGEDRIQEALTKFEAEVILSIFWRQINDEGKRAISSCKIVQWEGLEEKEVQFTDPVEKLKYIISGADELMAIWSAIIATKRKSLPEPSENAKKKVMGAES
jgi:hypothetical protein